MTSAQRRRGSDGSGNGGGGITAAGEGPLRGTTVLDLTTIGPGPRCTQLLGGYGAAVVKVGPVDRSLVLEPPSYAYGAGRGMRRARFDLKDEDGVAAFFALVASADVVVEAFRPGVADRLGVGYGAVSEANPGIVYCAISGYGRVGGRAAWAGHDLDYLAVAGYLWAGGRRADGGPPLPGATVADAAGGGMHAALSIAAALAGRARSGRGCFLDVSVVDGVTWLSSLMIDEHLATGAAPGPGHGLLTGRYACYDTYRAADGGWLAVGAIEPRFFANLCRALGCDRWVDHQYDDEAQEAIRADFRAAFNTRSRDEWVGLLAEAETCVAPVLSIVEVADEATQGPRATVVRATDPAGVGHLQLGPMLAGMPRPSQPVTLPDPETTDTEALLLEAGVPAATVAAWFARGAVA